MVVVPVPDWCTFGFRRKFCSAFCCRLESSLLSTLWEYTACKEALVLTSYVKGLKLSEYHSTTQEQENQT
jgi:hypothetical protein